MATKDEEKKQQAAFQYTPYQESEAVKQAQALLQQQLQQKPGAYQSQWQTQLNDTMNKILNREKFSYDLNGDALYNQYKDRYVQQGKMAMMDTMGQAQAMTGGYGNSYAQTAGQQAYQGHLQGLNDVIPELYQLALSRYQMEGDAMNQQLSLLQQQENLDYGRYQDDLNAYYNELDYLTGRYDSERNYDYGMYGDNRDFTYNQFLADRDYNFQLEQLAQQKAQWQKEFDEDKRRYDQEFALAQSKSSGGGGGGGGYGYDTHGMTTAEIKALQKELGVTADGIWGPKTEAAYQAKYGGGGGDNLTVDMNSVLNLGYGPISSSELDKLVQSGQVAEKVENGKITFTNKYQTLGGFTFRG